MAASRTHNFELFRRSIVGPGRGQTTHAFLEVKAELEAYDTEVVVEEISEIALTVRFDPDQGIDLDIDIDPTEGIGVALAEWASREFESIHVDDAAEIREESDQREADRAAEHYNEWQRELLHEEGR